VIIPARFGSTRFAAKILASETGKPLVQHVVEQASRCRHVRQVIVATDDRRIVTALEPFGTHAVMTRADHPSGTDRIAEVARDLTDDVIVNVQGDEPEIEPATIDALIQRLHQTPDEPMATAATRWPAGADPGDPNLVKVVLDRRGRALYFSRLPIPFARDRADRLSDRSLFLLHQGIYAYRREFLLQYASMPPTPLEQTEKLEQLRVLEHGHRIGVLVTDRAIHGIDTPEQYQAFVQRYKESGQWSVVGGQ
jgi:3-deoxy-manno-octulosonate cytidylyltransferase (CMP-KDO synthetase)